jgi:leader peptidase (prepilin peptidase)/N-methyltransferase
LTGAAIGSFLNVCIYRLPRGLSLLAPSSSCPHCGAKIAWRDNIPLLSFWLLRARCRHCKEVISFRYFFVELVSALGWLALWLTYGLSGYFFTSGIFLSLLFVVILTDGETGLIPDAVTIPGMIAGLAASVLDPALFRETIWYRGLLSSGTGLLAGGVLLWLAGFLGRLVFKKDSMGGGDIKLLAMIGSFIGWQKVLLTFFTAPFLALPFALYARFARREATLPYGPFLALAAALQFFFGNTFISYLLRY